MGSQAFLCKEESNAETDFCFMDCSAALAADRLPVIVSKTF
jgi:hypothetical protein